MAHNINFSTHGEAIQKAYQDVLDTQSATNWYPPPTEGYPSSPPAIHWDRALFGYDKASNDLKVISTGDGGLQELTEEFEGGKVLFAFCRVIDPNSKLPKCVFISWCGDGIPVSRKALVPAHVQDVKARLKGFHVEITARTEADVDPKAILKKVKDSTGANYSHQQKDLSLRKDIADTGPTLPTSNYQRPEIVRSTANTAAPTGSVGSVYQKPSVPTNAMAEAKKKALENLSMPTQASEPTTTAESLRKQREEEDRRLMEQEKVSFQERERQQQKQAVSQLVAVPSSITASPAQTPVPRPRVEEDRRLEQQKKDTEERQKREEDARRAREEERKQQQRRHEEEEEEQKRRRKEEQEEQERRRKADEDAQLWQAEGASRRQEQDEHHQQPHDAPVAMVLYDYAAQEGNEMDLATGEIVTDVVQLDPGWWQGIVRGADGSIFKAGLFPANYVELQEVVAAAQPTPSRPGDPDITLSNGLASANYKPSTYGNAHSAAALESSRNNGNAGYKDGDVTLANPIYEDGDSTLAYPTYEVGDVTLAKPVYEDADVTLARPIRNEASYGDFDAASSTKPFHNETIYEDADATLTADPDATVVRDNMEAEKTFSVRALYDYTAGEDNEISFREGEMIAGVRMVSEEWWR